VPQAEALIAATGADFRIGGYRAFYSPNYDFIQVPRPEAHFEPINWHRTVLHELSHWTGAAQRLDRDLSGSFGSKKYAHEELVAEITSAFVCASLGIVPTVRYADYIGSWLEALRENDRAIVRAPRRVEGGRLPTRVLPRVRRTRRRCRVIQPSPRQR
jgi:antirestriction protein ArdC